MKIGVLLMNFGEPETAHLETAVAYLARIFSWNAPLRGGGGSSLALHERSRALAESKAPGLVAEYEAIGGSPLHRQARDQAAALETELRERGQDAVVTLGMQFTEPSIADGVAALRAAGVDLVIGLPVYPLCGPSTTVAALREFLHQLEVQGWRVPQRSISGWHRHPGYVRLRVDAIRRCLEEHELSIHDAGTRLVFSAHGTPRRYLESGIRYDRYVQEICAAVAGELGVVDYRIGFQNHADGSGVAWTEPEVDEVIAGVDGTRVVVDAVSFMHEQSETLVDLDRELKAAAEARDLEFYRVPIPYMDPAFIRVLGDLVLEVANGADIVGEEAAAAESASALRTCSCVSFGGAVCTNALASGISAAFLPHDRSASSVEASA